MPANLASLKVKPKPKPRRVPVEPSTRPPDPNAGGRVKNSPLMLPTLRSTVMVPAKHASPDEGDANERPAKQRKVDAAAAAASGISGTAKKHATPSSPLKEYRATIRNLLTKIILPEETPAEWQGTAEAWAAEVKLERAWCVARAPFEEIFLPYVCAGRI